MVINKEGAKKYPEVSLSFFFPAYNEEENIEETVVKTDEVLKNLGLKEYEIIVINDSSKDKTAEIVSTLTKRYPALRLVNHKVNLGYGGALKTGFKESKYTWVAFADSDGQFDTSEITKFLELADDADLILGYRLERSDPFQRKVFTWGWKTMAKVLLGLPGRDYSCGFKMIKKKVYDAVLPLVSEEKVTQIEFLVKAKKKGFKFKEVGVHHYPRRFGNPTGGSLFSKVFLKSILDLFKLRLILR
jgi:glycosyltransferase involved in cell wall biosynthesis